MYQTENHDEYAFTITLDGHPVATVTRLGWRVEGDDAAGWATEPYAVRRVGAKKGRKDCRLDAVRADA